ncbi:Uu.00g113800.m01.CDS01 [Anthostomella pinea]|uniref:Uu.00g113800.m01.CDS01 n=1 Tax=Anthostomella pinea TaxID=933095 RepID=A0AAI8VG84_9PEZI|nr:Uu.00g113800.m01.CDS01 [Anthostomella pinea]
MADMILPKGIVFNKESVYQEIAKFDVVPTDHILKACHVFSITSRELFDPTARRLENFWTRVLGGDRRHLPGTVIARLFRDISEEPPFVKLRGPPNRYEPPSPKSQASETRKVQAILEESTVRPEEVRSKGKGRGKGKGKGKGKMVPPSPSSSKVPHPILKKPRGPSASGPRPTARFVSPSGSDAEDDDARESEVASSDSTAVTPSIDSNATVKEEKKKPPNTTPKKKTTSFMASTSSRRRPAMPRRPSSQSTITSTTSGPEVGPKEEDYSQAAPSTMSETSGKGSRAATIEQEGKERLTAKAAGKRPDRRSSADKVIPLRPSGPQTGNQEDRPVTVQEEAKRPTTPSKSKGKAPATASGIAHDVSERPRVDITSPMHRSRSGINSPRPGSRDLNRSRVTTPQSLISPSTATISNATAQGTIIEFDENAPAKEAVTGVMRELEDNPRPQQSTPAVSGTSERNTRFTPTQPNPTPDVPLGRSKSQLTLLLERQNEKKPRR